MKSHAVYLGPSSNDQKRSVFERLGRQLNSSAGHSASTSFNEQSLQAGPSSSTALTSSTTMNSNSMRKRPHEMDEWASNRKHGRRYDDAGSELIHPPPRPSSMYSSQDIDPMYIMRKKKKMAILGPVPTPAPPTVKVPKYDRHGNLIVSLKERFRAMSKPWDYGEGKSARRLGRNPIESYRSHTSRGQIPIGPSYSSSNPPQTSASGEESSRYARWRERRDVITSLDREAANLNSRTNNLKMTLQSKLLPSDEKPTVFSPSIASTSKSKIDDSSHTIKDNKPSRAPRPQPDEMSDGEIIDDEDSDYEETSVDNKKNDRISSLAQPHYPSKNNDHTLEEISDDEYETKLSKSARPARVSPTEGDKMREPNSTKTVLSRKSNQSDTHETISDDELDADNQRAIESSESMIKLEQEPLETTGDSSAHQSEIELLNALGIDWANLVEMAHSQSKPKKTTFIPGCARSRFLAGQYLRTIPVDADLAGPYLIERIHRLCFGEENKGSNVLYNEQPSCAFKQILKHETGSVSEDSETIGQNSRAPNPLTDASQSS